MALLLALLALVTVPVGSLNCTVLRDDCQEAHNSTIDCANLFDLCTSVEPAEAAEDSGDFEPAEDSGEAEDDRIPRKDIIAAGMLMAFVSYMMATVWLINHPDPGLHKQIWAVIHTQTSIFIAVMMYQAIKGMFTFFPEVGTCSADEATVWEETCNIALFCMFFLAWVFALHVITASLVWKHSAKLWQRGIPFLGCSNSKTKKWEFHRERLLLFWGMVMGHTVGFAAIDAFAYIQCRLHWLHSFGYALGVLVAIAVVLIVFRLFREFRNGLRDRAKAEDAKTPSESSKPLLLSEGLQVQSKKTEEEEEDVSPEEEEEDVWKMWAETVEETEEDAIALAVSFLLCQMFRVMIDGKFPFVDGTEPRHSPAETGPLETTHSFSDAAWLAAAGFIVYFGILLILKVTKHNFDGLDTRVSSGGTVQYQMVDAVVLRRMKSIAMDVGSMGIAWTSYFSMYWFLDTLNHHLQSGGPSTFNCGSGGMTGLVGLAMFSTGICYVIIFIIRTLTKMFSRKAKTMQSIFASVLKATGLIIGFAWEKCFDTAVEDITNASNDEEASKLLQHRLMRLILTMFIAALVGEVWRRHMLLELMGVKKEDEVTREFHKLEKEQSKANVKELLKPDDFDEFMKRHEKAYYKSRRQMRQLLNPGDCELSEGDQAAVGRVKGDNLLANAERYNHMHSIVQMAEATAEYDCGLSPIAGTQSRQ